MGSLRNLLKQAQFEEKEEWRNNPIPKEPPPDSPAPPPWDKIFPPENPSPPSPWDEIFPPSDSLMPIIENALGDPRKNASFQKRAYAQELYKRAYLQEMYKRAYINEMRKQANIKAKLIKTLNKAPKVPGKHKLIKMLGGKVKVPLKTQFMDLPESKKVILGALAGLIAGEQMGISHRNRWG